MPLSPATPILLVDDEPLMLEVMSSILLRLGYMEVDQAQDGTNALTMMWHRAYGLVISDLKMEPMSGLELLKAVRADRLLKETPFILTTASMNGRHVFDAKLAGVDGYLLKPFSPGALAEKLATVRSVPLPEVVQRDLLQDYPPKDGTTSPSKAGRRGIGRP